MSSYDALRSDAAWIDLSDRGKIRVTGEDRARLLHAMSTQHINDLSAGTGAYAFFLSAQGRILADAYIYNLGESCLLDTEPELAEKLLQHLDRYIIADDAEVKDETAEWAAIGLEGPKSKESASSLGLPWPVLEYSSSGWENGFVVRVAETGAHGLRIFVPRAELPTQAKKFGEAGIPQASEQEAQIVRLENGKARYGEDISERYLVQETEILHAVHSNKGCYLGQEIVERVRSRAQIHRHLRAIRIAGLIAPSAGTKLTVDGKDVAEITSAAYSPALSEVVGLAYVRSEATVGGISMTVAGLEPPVLARLA